MAYVQEGKLCKVNTPLGEDYFSLRRLSGEESVSRPFRYLLDLAAPDDAVDFSQMIGQSVTVTIDLADGQPRYLNGIVSQFAQSATSPDMSVYRAEIVPWLWLLTRRSDCRIFQQMTVPEIIAQIFDQLGFPNYEIRSEGTYESWDYCVQYRESDFNFISRLLEQEGLFYFFEHEADLHRLVIADSPAKNIECPGQETAQHDSEAGVTTDRDVVTSWRPEQTLQPSKYSLTDFAFLDPTTSLQVSTNSAVTAAADDKFEIYDYPGDYVKMGPEAGSNIDRGESRVKLITEMADAAAVVVAGSGCCRPFVAGYRFKLEGHNREDFNQEYLLTSVSHLLEQDAATGSGSEITARYENEFTCIPHAVPFRPPRITPKPVINGPQTAFVVGKADEEIHTDEHGRVKVQFHWDRLSEADEMSSCWIRAGQLWAGKSWGGLFVPRIGNEVIVEFIEGDPDRPLITGSVYNATSPPPYEIADEPTLSGIKTLSSKKGEGFNEIRFDDKKDAEEIFIHGQKNLDFAVENDRREQVGNDRHLIVKKDKYEHVQNNRHETVDADHLEEITKDRHLKVAGKEAKAVTGSLSLAVDGDVIQMYKASVGAEATGDMGFKADNLVLTGMTSFTIKVGGSSIVVDSSGVTLTGATLTLDGSTTNINSGPGSKPGSFTAAALVEPTPPEKPAEVGTSEAGSMAEVTPHKVAVTTGEDAVCDEASEDETEKTWIEIKMVDEDDNPVTSERYQVELPDGSVASGSLNEEGIARIERIEEGDCKVSFPDLDKGAWEKI